jgi:serine/threonine-protein kinase
VLRGTVLLAVMFGLGYVAATRVMFPVPAPPPDLLGVPDLTGLDLEGAGTRAEEAGLGLGAVDSMYHPSASAGSILGQSPLPGQLALPGAAVELAISLGPEHRPVPDMIGQRERRARVLLGANGFSVAVDSVEGEEPAGEVIAMEPEAGTAVNLPFEVRLAISLGPPTVEMPLLLGQSEEEAVRMLDSLGLFLTEIELDSFVGTEAGVVIEQDPLPASTVEVGSDVRLLIGDRSQLPVGVPRPDTAGSTGTITMSANMIRVIPLRVRSAGSRRPQT